MERICKECGEPFNGRVGKKFCTDACRNAYNNKQYSCSNNYVRNVDNILKRNRRILMERLDPATGKSRVHKEKLLGMGFNFRHHTHTYKTRTGSIYFFCYEYGYLPISDDFMILVKWNEKEN